MTNQDSASNNEAIASVQFGDTGTEAYSSLESEYLATLIAPLDDMWASFSDSAEPAALFLGSETVGCASVDEAGELQRFYVRAGHEHASSSLLDALRSERSICGITATTVDPFSMTNALPVADSVEQVARMYQLNREPAGEVLSSFEVATISDHDRVRSFMMAALGAPEEFVNWYVKGVIDRSELYLHEANGTIAGTGECRTDSRFSGHAHLGIIVGSDHRNAGLGTNLMTSLVRIAQSQSLLPLCSTEPQNTAAQRLIAKAGFDSRHSVFRIALA